MHVWSNAWEDADVSTYLDSYLPEYQPADMTSHQQWAAKRRQRLRRAGKISIEIHIESMSMLDTKRAELVFVQRYQASNYQDRVRKKMILDYHRDQWRIGTEEQLASLPTAPLLPQSLEIETITQD